MTTEQAFDAMLYEKHIARMEADSFQDMPVIENGTLDNAPDYALKGSLSRSAPEAPKTAQNGSTGELGVILWPGALSDTQARDLLALDPGVATIHYVCIRTAMLSVITLEPIEATIKRVTGQVVASISIYDPQLDAKLAAVWGVR